MILRDVDIKEAVESGEIGITRYDEKFVQPASYDLHLSRYFRMFHIPTYVLDTKRAVSHTKPFTAGEFVLMPKQFILASTIEKITLPNNFCGRLEGKSSLGRLGVIVHATAGFCDPGFKGHVTLEIANLNSLPIKIYAGMPIGQMSFQLLSGDAMVPYGSKGRDSKYQDQQEQPAESQFWQNFPDKCLEI